MIHKIKQPVALISILLFTFLIQISLARLLATHYLPTQGNQSDNKIFIALIMHGQNTGSHPAPDPVPNPAPDPDIDPDPDSDYAADPDGMTPSFLETFDGNPSQPQPWRPDNWDITIHSRDGDTWKTLEPMQAAHGSDCAPPPARHQISAYEDAVFICRNHMMTAINATGYGVIYLTPNHMVDFSEGEAVIRFDLSTERTSGRDWVSFWITPYQDHLQLPLQLWMPDLSGEPRHAIHIVMGHHNNGTVFRGSLVRDFNVTGIDGANWWRGYQDFLTPSAQRRDTFELRISRTHLKFGMPDYNFWWIDNTIPELDWSQGIVQFGHHSYTPRKECPFDECHPNTWHWDNISIHPSRPFTMLHADKRFVDATTGSDVHFPAPAPANAHLRFAAAATNLQVSFDGGNTWQPAQLQVQQRTEGYHFKSYWTPVPAGITSVQIRGENLGHSWHVRDIAIWSLSTE